MRYLIPTTIHIALTISSGIFKLGFDARLKLAQEYGADDVRVVLTLRIRFANSPPELGRHLSSKTLSAVWSSMTYTGASMKDFINLF